MSLLISKEARRAREIVETLAACGVASQYEATVCYSAPLHGKAEPCRTGKEVVR